MLSPARFVRFLFMKYCLFVIGLFVCAATGARVQVPALERVEPGNWFTGMPNPNLQLLVHGGHIAERRVSLQYPGVQLRAVHKVANPNYLFVDLVIASAAQPGSFAIHFSRQDTADIVYNYQLQPKPLVQPNGVNSSDLIYLLMPDRFANGDTGNDRVAGMNDSSLNRDSMYYRHGGDIAGLMGKLDYLKSLGVTAVWCTPEMENNEPHASYHGYAVTDHYKIDPRYGTNELYKAYVAKCHAMGLKVIKDIVHNHIGSEHFTIRDMPMPDWVHEWPVYTNSNFKDQAVMDPHAAAADKKQMLDGWFDKHMPDLNESNPYVQRYLTQNHIWWIAYAGIDGLRLDTYPYNDAAYMAQWAQEVKAAFPNLSIFGETLVNSVLNQAYFTQGNTVHRGLDTHLPGITDAQVKDAIYEALNGQFGWTTGVNRLYAVLANDFVYEDATRNVVFLDNHDMSRFYSLADTSFTKFKSGIALLLTMRGIPQLYYGTEILMKNFSNPDGLVRADMKGGWPGDSINQFTAAGRTALQNEAFNYVQKLANYRKNNTALQTGRLMQYIPENGVYVYFRYNAQQTVMIAFNGNDSVQQVDVARFNERVNGFTKATDIVNGAAVALPGKLTLQPRECRVLELGK